MHPVSAFQQPLPCGGGIGSQRCGGPEASDDDVAHEFSSVGDGLVRAGVRDSSAPDTLESALVLDDVVDGVANGLNVLGLLVGDLDAELVDTGDVVDDVSHVGEDLVFIGHDDCSFSRDFPGPSTRSVWVVFVP